MAASFTITERRSTSLGRVGVCIALVVSVSTLGLLVAYFADARIQGTVYYRACSCGMTPATISGGKVILAESNHDTPAGAAIAMIDIQDNACTITQVDNDGNPTIVHNLTVDHLGAKYVEHDDTHGPVAVYVVEVDNWKLYPARLFRYFSRWMSSVLR